MTSADGAAKRGATGRIRGVERRADRGPPRAEGSRPERGTGIPPEERVSVGERDESRRGVRDSRGSRTGQGEEERRAFAQRRLGPDVAAMATYDATHRGEPDAIAFELSRRMQSLEGREQLRLVGLIEPNAVVAHEERFGTAAVGHSELDAGLLHRPGELERVPDEVVEHDTEEALIAGRAQPVDGAKRDGTFGLALGMLGRDPPRKTGKVDGHQVQLGTDGPR